MKVIIVGTHPLYLEIGHLTDLVDICYIPTIFKNLIYLFRIDELGYYISFGNGKLNNFIIQ